MTLILPSTPHRFARLLEDMPILDELGTPMWLDEATRNRGGHFLDGMGLRKTESMRWKHWDPPRGQNQPGNCGYWVPVDTPDPPEIKLPDPDHMTAEEREWLRDRLAQFDD